MKKLLLLFTMVLVTSMGLLAQGSTWQTATLISSGQTKTGAMGTNNSEDWYKINVTQEGTVDFTAIVTSGNLTLSNSSSVKGVSTSGDLYDRYYLKGKESFRDDTITLNAINVGKGTYYIKIDRYGGSGGYKLYYKFTPCPQTADPEPNNDYEHSSLIESGSTVQGRLGHRTSDDITDSEDWYKIVVPEEGHVELMATSTATATENMLLSTNASYVAGYKNGGTYSRGNISAPGYSNDTITYLATDMGKGTYYIRIARYNGCGGYKLYYEFTPCSLAADPEPNNDYQHSSRLVNGKITEGRLGHRTSDDVTDNEDWYRINVPKEGPIEITVTATENLILSTYSSQVYSVNADGSLKSLGSISASGYGNAKITYSKDDMAAGYYYIRICRYSGCGGYRINYNGPAIPGDVDNDGIVDVSDIVVLIDNVLGGSTLPIDATVADMNQDGVIDIVDVVALIDLVLNG